MQVTFCGHSDVYDDVNVKQWLIEVTGSLIHKGAKIKKVNSNER